MGGSAGSTGSAGFGGVDADMRGVRVTALRTLQALIGRVNASRDLTDTLQAVVDGVVSGLGFRVAVVNLVRDDGTVEVVAVAGSEDARRALLGQRGERADWDREFALADEWGALCFVPHERYISDDPLPSWIPDTPVSDAADAWHPEDALFAPLWSPSGELVGVLSVDLPHDGRRPGRLQRELLTMFAAQAGIAIDNALLAQRLRAEQDLLASSEERFRLAFDNSPIGMAIIGLGGADRGHPVRVNQALCDMLGYTADELAARPMSALTYPEDRPRERDAVRRCLAGEIANYRTEQRYLHADGTLVWVSLNTSVVRDADRIPRYLMTQIEDITDRKAAQFALAHQASHDPLTGLANRGALLERLGDTLASAGPEPSGAVLFCDLDGFKLVNDALGHGAGDHVLQAVGRRLADQVRPTDLVARLGGDEFVVLAETIDSAELDRFAERIERSVSEPVWYEGRPLVVTASVGIVLLSEASGTAQEVLRDADTAMYRAKALGRNRHEIFTECLRARAFHRAHAEVLLRAGLADGRLVVHYQPIVDLLTGAVRGVEALSRLRLENGELLAPEEFMPAAEESDLIHALGRHVLADACARAVRWRARSDGDFVVAVNVAPRELASEGFAPYVLETLDANRLPPAALHLEITESAVVEATPTIRRTLEELRAAGVAVGVDDFGTGYASLRYLRQLPVSFVKVDRSFVAGLPASREDGAIVRAVSSLAAELGIRCIGEGIETPGQAESLVTRGVDWGQGFLFGEPADPADIDVHLSAHINAHLNAGTPRGMRTPG